MYATAQELEDNKPRLGDRVKLCGNHRFAGHTAVYLCDKTSSNGVPKPYVKILDGERAGDRSIVWDPETQMRKL